VIVSKKPEKRTKRTNATQRSVSKVPPPRGGWYQYRHICKALGIALRTAKKYVRRGRIPSPEYRNGRAYWSTLAMDEIQRLGVQPDGTYTVVESRQARIAREEYRERVKDQRTKGRKKGGAR